MAEVERFKLGATTIIIRDDYVRNDPEEIRQSLERIGQIYERSMRRKEKEAT